jgi:hypothetical protein
MGPGERIARAGLRTARRVLAVITGFTVLLAGIVMIFTPGPGLVGIWLGLVIIATEFAWARRVLVRARRAGRQARDGVQRWRQGGDVTAPPDVISSDGDSAPPAPAGARDPRDATDAG